MEKNSQQQNEGKIALSIELPSKLPSLSYLSSLGFDRVELSKSSCTFLKIESKDINGKPVSFYKITLSKKQAVVEYSCPVGSHQHCRRLKALLLLFRTLRLIPKAKADLQQLTAAALPSLEFSEKIAEEPYEILLQKLESASEAQRQSKLQRQRLVGEVERYSSLCALLEKENNALRSRVSQLESVSDRQLQELLLEWISSHNGTLNLPKFSSTHNLPIARCEEGLLLLLKKGVIIELPGRLDSASNIHERKFLARKPIFSTLPERIYQQLFSISKLFKLFPK
ncbi:MAG: hypothetical protein QW275_00320 [Candidatus Anstonellaceae archaeon]